MPDWDEEALKEINSLDSARLAIRGALATIRDLQDLTAKLKAEVQDSNARRKASDARIGELTGAIERWQEQAKQWEEAERRRAQEEERYRSAIRLQVRSEERSQIQQAQRLLEEELAKLQAELQRMAADHLKKEERWALVGKKLEEREAALVQAEREKAELANRYRSDIQTVESLRSARDREIAATVKSRELELDDRNREIAALRREGDELKAALAALGRDWQLKLQESEEKLAKDYQLKERALQERYAKRELELQSSWSELENGLWKRAKDAREKLDKAAAQQFEERARALADRSQEIDDHLERRRKELDEDFARRCREAETRYAEQERSLKAGWLEKEEKFLKNFEAELTAEKQKMAADWSGKLKELDNDRARMELGLAQRREELEREVHHQKDILLEEAARKDAERVRRQDEFMAKQSAELAKKEAELDAQALAAEAARQEAALADKRAAAEDASARSLALVQEQAAIRDAALEDKRKAEVELNQRRIALIDANARALELSRQTLDKQFEERVSSLDAAYAAKVGELDRARKACEDQLIEFKARIATEYSLKERNLDSRWAAREQELVVRYEGQLQAQRDDFEKRLSALREEAQARQLMEQSGMLNRKNELEAHYEQLNRTLRAELAAREDDSRKRFDAQLSALRDGHLNEVQTASEAFAAELARVKTDALTQQTSARKAADQAQLRAIQLEGDLSEAARRLQAQFDDFQARQRAWEAERLAFEQQFRERETQREAKYQEMERSLQELWGKKEEAAAQARLKAMETQTQAFADQAARAEESLRKQFEQTRLTEQTDQERRHADWQAAREQDLAERRKILEAHYEARMSELAAQMRKREVELQRQKDEEMDKLRADMNAYLKTREEAFNAQLLALQNQQALSLEQQRAQPKPPTEEGPKSSD